MSEISHQQARALLENLRSDPLQGRALEIHLERCQECQDYAIRLKGLEDRLGAVFKNWTEIKPRLDTRLIIERGISRQRLSSRARAFGKLAFAPVFAALILFLAYFIRPDGFSASQAIDISAIAPGGAASSTLTPTPSSTISATSLPACQEIVYIVQENETLEWIASRFGVRPEAILENNQVSEIRPGMALRLLTCNPTPTGLPGTPTLTMTAAGQ